MMPPESVDAKHFKAMDAGLPPWDVGRAQKAFVNVADQVVGSILDIGCGTGENALYFAERGHDDGQHPIQPSKTAEATAYCSKLLPGNTCSLCSRGWIAHVNYWMLPVVREFGGPGLYARQSYYRTLDSNGSRACMRIADYPIVPEALVATREAINLPLRCRDQVRPAYLVGLMEFRHQSATATAPPIRPEAPC